MIKKDSCLEELKREYEKLQKKYNLPSFKQLNEEFEIERAAEHETELLLRRIRKAIAEKTIAVLQFLEMLVNPVNAPFFMFTILKNLSHNEKKLIEKIYMGLCDIEISAISLDVNYDEKAEAAFIKQIVKRWKNMKDDLEELSKVIEKAWHISSEKKEKSYFG